jgi:hypothetical protein
MKRIERPDGTLTLYSYEMKTAGGTTTNDVNQASIWITTMDEGYPNSALNAISVGSRTVTTTNRAGVIVETKKIDIGSGLKVSHTIATQFDSAGRIQTLTDVLSGKSELTIYDCCSLSSKTDQRGLITTFSEVNGSSLQSAQGITTKTDQVGLETITTRQGTDGSWLELSRTTTNLAGETASSHTLGSGTTTYTRDTTIDGFQRLTTTYGDGGTKVDLSYQDGKPYKTMGTAGPSMLYETGYEENVNANGTITTCRWDKQTALNPDGSPTAEWSRTWTDFAGRQWKTDSSAGAFTLTFYNSDGQVSKSVDADEVTTLIEYDSFGEITTAIDMDRDNVIDKDGTDRITKTTKAYTTRAGAVVEQTTTEMWLADGSDIRSTVSITDRSVDGLQTWTKVGGLTTATMEMPTGGTWAGNWTVTTNYPDSSSSVDTYTSGRLVRRARKDSAGIVIQDSQLEYDAHGRLWKQTDGRGAQSITLYRTAANPGAGGHPLCSDQVLTIQAPPRLAGGIGPITTFGYDSMGRQVLLTDSL